MDKLLALLPGNPYSGGEVLQAWQVGTDEQVQAVTLPMEGIARGRYVEVVAVVPVNKLSWHNPLLPTGLRIRGDARLKPVLQGLLEEILLCDPVDAHIALQPGAQAGRSNVVAVCDKAWISGWLAAFEQTGIKVARVVPQVTPEALENAGICTGRMHDAWLTALFNSVPLTLPASIESANLLADQKWRVQPAVFDDAVLCIPEDQLSLLTDAQWAAQILNSDWDLAQHEFASNPWERWRRRLKHLAQEVSYAPAWRSSRWALASLALISVLGLNAKAWWSQHLLQSKQAAIAQTLQDTFPHVRVIVDAPVQMERELKTLRQSSGIVTASDLQPLLAAAGIALSGQTARPTAWEYSGNSLLLRGLKPELVKQMNDRLEGTNYRVAQQGDALSLQVAN